MLSFRTGNNNGAITFEGAALEVGIGISSNPGRIATVRHNS